MKHALALSYRELCFEPALLEPSVTLQSGEAVAADRKQQKPHLPSGQNQYDS